MTDEVWLMCSSVANFGDDLSGFCVDCQRLIVFRPHAAAIAVKLCQSCAVRRMATVDVRVGITRETIRELDLYFRTTRGVQ